MTLRTPISVAVAFAAVLASTTAWAGDAAKPAPSLSAKATAGSQTALTTEAKDATPAPGDGGKFGAPAAGGVAKFGAPISQAKPLALAQLLASPLDYQGKTLVVEGKVADVCQVKGCWMTLRHEDREMRVHFKDYGFFVPMDASGKTARVEGVFEIEAVPVEEARHYLEDAGKGEDAAKITAPVPSFTFVASGVELR